MGPTCDGVGGIVQKDGKLAAISNGDQMSVHVPLDAVRRVLVSGLGLAALCHMAKQQAPASQRVREAGTHAGEGRRIEEEGEK